MTTELAFVLSGGTTNTDPDASLGGDPSTTPLGDQLNDLFDDISGAELAAGAEDYKCFYVFNDSGDDFADFKMWIESQLEGGSDVELGITTQDEIQELTFVNTAGGSFRLGLESYATEDISYIFDPNSQATAIQAALRELPNASEVAVESVTSATYRVTWQGNDANKKLPLMTLETNDFIRNNPLLEAKITFVEAQAGSPVNSIAPDIGTTTSPPNGVDFLAPDGATPISIGLLRTTEGFPVWVRRVVQAGATPSDEDGVVIRCSTDRVIGGA